MNGRDNWKNLPVWKCPDDDCSMQWASFDAHLICPSCHILAGENTGFTCGEVAEAEEKFGFQDNFPVHIPVPVPELVQLSTLPRETWEGLPVFHPCSQEGTKCNWLLYDVGVVIEVYPDPDIANEWQCRFISKCSGTLHYAPSNLWVPDGLAKRLI